MSITLNAKGTSVPSFTIGKGGVTIYQGLTDPSLSYSMKDGDYWLDKSLNSLKVWTVVGATWQAPRLADLHFVNSTIVAPGGQDLTLSVDANQYVNIDAGNTGPALITASAGQDLHINPAVGGGQYLVLCGDRWPPADGTSGQTLVTDGNGTLNWTNTLKSGSGTATINFGSSPGLYETYVDVTGLTNILSTSTVILVIKADATSADHTAADHRNFTNYANLTYTTPVTGVGFTIYSTSQQLVQGQWTVHYSWANLI